MQTLAKVVPYVPLSPAISVWSHDTTPLSCRNPLPIAKLQHPASPQSRHLVLLLVCCIEILIHRSTSSGMKSISIEALLTGTDKLRTPGSDNAKADGNVDRIPESVAIVELMEE